MQIVPRIVSSKAPPPPKGRRASAALLGVVLCALTFSLFRPALDCGFFNLDDPDYVTANALVRQGLTAESIGGAFRTPVLGNWAPLVTLSYQLDWSFFGPDPAGFHLTSILFHAANAGLVFALFLRLGLSRSIAFALAALFAWHPLRVESVVWISERKDVLSGFWFLVTLLCYLRCREPANSRAARRSWYGTALLTFGLGLLSKPMLVTTPLVLLLLDFLPTAGASALRPRGATLRGLLVGKLPFLIPSAGIALATLVTQQAAGATAGPQRPLAESLATALAALPSYLGKIVWPTHLTPFYPLPAAAPMPLAVVGTVVLLVMLILGVTGWRRRPWLGIGWFWFLGMLVPVSGAIQVGGQFIADRYTYLPVLGLLLSAGFALEALRPRCNALVAIGLPAAACLLLCSILTIRQTRLWQDPVALWRHTLAHTTHNPLAHLHLGNALLSASRLPEAEHTLRQALQLAPRLAPAHVNLGTLLAMTGRTDDALVHLRTAVALGTPTPKAQLNIARIQFSAGRCTEAAATCRAILARWPGQPEATALLASAMKRIRPFPSPRAAAGTDPASPATAP